MPTTVSKIMAEKSEDKEVDDMLAEVQRMELQAHYIFIRKVSS